MGLPRPRLGRLLRSSHGEAAKIVVVVFALVVRHIYGGTASTIGCCWRHLVIPVVVTGVGESRGR